MNPRDLTALAADVARAPLEVEAAALGLSIPHAALRRARASINERIGATEAAWRELSRELRQVLLTLATNRTDTETAALLPWAAFTDGERASLGALAREWRRALDVRAGWLR